MTLAGRVSGVRILMSCVSLLACRSEDASEPARATRHADLQAHFERLEAQRELAAGLAPDRLAVVVAADPSDSSVFLVKARTLGLPHRLQAESLRLGRSPESPVVLVIRPPASPAAAGVPDTVRVPTVPSPWVELRTPAILIVPGLVSDLEFFAGHPALPLRVLPDQRAGRRGLSPEWVGARLRLRRQGATFVAVASTQPLEP
jgi:hypothetical protein